MRSFINLWHAMGIYRPMVKKWDRKLKKSILCKHDIWSVMALELFPNGWLPEPIWTIGGRREPQGNSLGAFRKLHENMSQYISLLGDHWRKRHDKFKMMIQWLCVWYGLDCEVEVFNLFAGSIPQEGLSRMGRGRKIQSIVPDLAPHHHPHRG